MSVTAVPIPIDLFQLAILDLDLQQLHNEAARLKNSIHHLELSNASLVEFKDDVDCKQALDENEDVIRQQKDRILVIEREVEKRGYRMGHGDEKVVNGDGAGEDGHRDDHAQPPSEGQPAANGVDGGDDDGVYL